jgi:hypothetical protein
MGRFNTKLTKPSNCMFLFHNDNDIIVLNNVASFHILNDRLTWYWNWIWISRLVGW